MCMYLLCLLKNKIRLFPNLTFLFQNILPFNTKHLWPVGYLHTSYVYCDLSTLRKIYYINEDWMQSCSILVTILCWSEIYGGHSNHAQQVITFLEVDHCWISGGMTSQNLTRWPADYMKAGILGAIWMCSREADSILASQKPVFGWYPSTSSWPSDVKQLRREVVLAQTHDRRISC